MTEPTLPSPIVPSIAIEPRVLLGLDTCGPVGTVALVEVPTPSTESIAAPARLAAQTARLAAQTARMAAQTARLPAQTARLVAQTELAGRSFSARLIPAIADLLTDSSLTLAHLAGVVVVVGPGSFTGIRVGLSAAKGLVEAVQVPVQVPLIAVSRLATLAAAAEDGASEKTDVLAVLDAGRGEYFCGEYRAGRRVREWLADDEDLARAAAAPLRIVVCEETLVERLQSLGPRHVAPPTAEFAVRYALPRFFAGDFDDPATTDANYLRSSDAELFRKAAPETHADARAETHHADAHAEAPAPSPAASHVAS
jgi:tRNA threonylcarbamoyladenosine biosynthesis protein TsaB